MDWAYIGSTALLAIGFGFVIFWHELGHFLAAKWAGVKVEQFAVGFGHAMFSWRKGLGFRWGSSAKELESKINSHLGHAPESSSQLEQAAHDLKLGETEYRLNWIPLGGYVKMLGQDDMDPNSLSDSPRAYNNKPIGKRMVIVSAGVIMNAILAIALFTVLFRIGFDVPPPVVGNVIGGSPADRAGVRPGDRVLYLNGTYQYDFTKISQNVALLQADRPTNLIVQGADGAQRNLTVTPSRESDDGTGFLKLGLLPSAELRGVDPKALPKDWEKQKKLVSADTMAVEPGDTITQINGKPVAVTDYYKLVDATQAGEPVTLTLKNPAGQTRDVQVRPSFAKPFNSEVSFLGMTPRTEVDGVISDSVAQGKIQPGDDIVSVTVKPANDTYTNLSPEDLRTRLGSVSTTSSTVDIVVLRDGKEVHVNDLSPQTRLEEGKRGLGILTAYDAAHAVIGKVDDGSPAARAGIAQGATIISIDDQPVASWYDIHRILRAIKQPTKVRVGTKSGAQENQYDIELTAVDIVAIDSIRYASEVMLHELTEPRKTSNPVMAAKWGVGETRDLAVQFYLMLRRMGQGSVSPKNAMGPIGIFTAGARFANRGMDWLIWFLAMISANLAMVNFLPVPIVDGGLFTFLIIEKIMRRPLSPRVQSIAQIVGLALIASVFLFVTYHDIHRLIF